MNCPVRQWWSRVPDPERPGLRVLFAIIAGILIFALGIVVGGLL